MNLDDAVAKHAAWKTKFRVAISKKEQMDASSISKDNCCELGKWLYGEGKANFGHMSSHAECVQKHALFHKEAGKIASEINASKFTQAEAMLGSGTPYAQISMDVGVAISRLKKDANL